MNKAVFSDQQKQDFSQIMEREEVMINKLQNNYYQKYS